MLYVKKCNSYREAKKKTFNTSNMSKLWSQMTDYLASFYVRFADRYLK